MRNSQIVLRPAGQYKDLMMIGYRKEGDGTYQAIMTVYSERLIKGNFENGTYEKVSDTPITVYVGFSSNKPI